MPQAGIHRRTAIDRLVAFALRNLCAVRAYLHKGQDVAALCEPQAPAMPFAILMTLMAAPITSAGCLARVA